MTSTSTPSRAPNWPLILLAFVGLILVSPLLFAFLIAGLALTVGIVGVLLKVGVVALVVWAVAMLFKRVLGSGRSSPRPVPTPRVEPRTWADPDAEIARERRESLAALDRELAQAIANKKGPSAQ